MLLLWGLLAGCSATAEARSPPKKRPEDHVAGEQIWERSCWQCHGEDNDGQGPAASALPGDVHSVAVYAKAGSFYAQRLEGAGLELANGCRQAAFLHLGDWRRRWDRDGLFANLPPDHMREPPPFRLTAAGIVTLSATGKEMAV